MNFVGLGATIVGMQATTGLLFAKSLSAAAYALYQPAIPVFTALLAVPNAS